jgi:dTDP-4-dehydrorhamnose 3,5-epimerase
MEFIEAGLPGAWYIKPRVFRDERGFFLETYAAEGFAERGMSTAFVQDNHSRSLRRGVLRGMHFQRPPHTQAKLIRAVRGAIYDVIVDLRRGSPTYGQWRGFELDDTDLGMLYVPHGFAHGFCTLTDETDVVYKVDAYYAPECDGGLLWSDPDVNISWPVQTPLLSKKDRELPRLAQLDSPFQYA